MPERFRGELLTMGCYTNPASFTFTFTVNTMMWLLIWAPGTAEELAVCALMSEPGYVIYSACGSFWVPMIIMVMFYARIYRTASRASAAVRLYTDRRARVLPATDQCRCTAWIHPHHGRRWSFVVVFKVLRSQPVDVTEQVGDVPRSQGSPRWKFHTVSQVVSKH